MKKFKWTIAGKTDKGKVRANNEDNLLVDEELGLIAVADGMGGHLAGEVASRMAAQILEQNLRNLTRSDAKPENADPKYSLGANRLAFCVKLANQAIFEASKQYTQDKGMGTTISAVLIQDNIISTAHVGDSRIYLVRNGHLEQLTKDHSLVMDQVRQGLITKEQAEKSNLQHVLSRALGVEDKIEVDVEEHPVFAGDMFLLCTDGLNKMVSDKELLTIIASVKHPQAISETLIEAANAAGGRDNITVIAALAQKAGLFDSLKSKIIKTDGPAKMPATIQETSGAEKNQNA